MFTKSSIFIFIILVASANLVLAQKKPLKIRTNLDEKNKLTDVKKEDLKLFEDGVVQKIDKLIKKESVNLGILVDKSGSMRSQINLIKHIALNLALNLDKDDEAFVTSFSSTSNVQIYQDWTNDKTLLKMGISGIYIEGGESALFDAVYLAAEKFKKKKNNKKRNTILLISDCENRNSFI